MAEKQPPHNPDEQSQSDWKRAYDDLARVIRNLPQSAGGNPAALSTSGLEPINTALLLTNKLRRTVAFPPCADELLGLFRTSQPDDITKYFNEYFKFARHPILGESRDSSGNPENLNRQLAAQLDPPFSDCIGESPIVIAVERSRSSHDPPEWPTSCCFCPSCVTLDGNRNSFNPGTSSPFDSRIKRLFVADALWLFYFEQLGVFQILGAILDAFAYSGRLPILSSSTEPDIDIRIDLIGLVLEAMVRQTKSGGASTVRDRAAAYRTCLGWVSNSGRKLQLDTEVNTGFNTLFHRFIYNALVYYRDKRLAVAIQGAAATTQPPSVATLITISDTIDVLKRRFEAFDYGRNYYNTLSGIVWLLAGMLVVRELRTTLGIPPAFNDASEFIPAAYDILVLKRPVTHGDANRYLIHKECAQSGRDILLDLEVIDFKKNLPGQDLERWLTQVEAKIEGYRTAYRTLTGVDLGSGPTPAIQQQA